jgi:transcriptional regulator with XRE-family HTH domain
VDAPWFKLQLQRQQLSQRGLARRLGLDHAAIVRMFQGQRAMRIEEAAEIARLLAVDVRDVLHHAGARVRRACDLLN